MLYIDLNSFTNSRRFIPYLAVSINNQHKFLILNKYNVSKKFVGLQNTFDYIYSAQILLPVTDNCPAYVSIYIVGYTEKLWPDQRLVPMTKIIFAAVYNNVCLH